MAEFLFTKLGFHQLQIDHGNFIIVIIPGSKKKLATTFDMVNIRSLTFYISLKCNCIQKIIKLSQLRSIKKMLDWHGWLRTKTAKISMWKMLLLFYEKNVSVFKKIKYARKIRFIIYTIMKNHINIAFASSMISYFSRNTRLKDFNALNQI